MKRRIAVAAVALALIAGGLWLAGRAPTEYVLQRECGAYQAERLAAYGRLDAEAARAREPADAARLRAERDAVRAGHRRLEIRGWEVLLIPAGAPRPSGDDFLVAMRYDPGQTHVALRGPIVVWYAPRGGLARLLYRLGLTP